MNQETNYLLSILLKFSWLGGWIFLFIAMFECIPFIGYVFPGGTLIFMAGILAGHGYFNPIYILIFSTIGAFCGDLLMYFFGRWGGKIIREKNIIKEANIIRSENFFKKYGASSIFWTRFSGSTWATMPFISGSMKVKTRVFLFWNALGALGWSATRVLLGYFSGNIIAVIIRKWSDRLATILLVLAVIAFLYWFINKHHQNIWRWYVKLSQNFCNKLFSQSWFKKLLTKYPVIDEFIQTKISQEKILGGFIGIIILVLLYSLVLILDLI